MPPSVNCLNNRIPGESRGPWFNGPGCGKLGPGLRQDCGKVEG